MLSLAMDSRDAVDSMNRAAAAHGGQADVNPVQDLGFMYSRDLADPDGHLGLACDTHSRPRTSQFVSWNVWPRASIRLSISCGVLVNGGASWMVSPP